MITHILGYPRIGGKRELKKACESYWADKITSGELIRTGREIRSENWQMLNELGLDFIPSNDFSYYDQVLDMTLAVGAIPYRFLCLQNFLRNEPMEFYFALARGYQKEGYDITPMEMTKWFNTNYHYIVPEFYRNQKFKSSSLKYLEEFLEARDSGITTRPVLIGPVSYLLLGKEKEPGFHRLDLLPNLLPVYIEMLTRLWENGARWVQIDEPYLVMDIDERAGEAFRKAYSEIRKILPDLKILLVTYFEGLGDNARLAAELPVDAIHIDLVRSPGQLRSVLDLLPDNMNLSLGIVDGRNVWKNDFAHSLRLVYYASDRIGMNRVMIGSSCSLLHSPIDLDLETDEESLPLEIHEWMSFARQKAEEIVTIGQLASHKIKINNPADDLALYHNQESLHRRKSSEIIHDGKVKGRLSDVKEIEKAVRSDFAIRKVIQQKKLNLPAFPSTTIGSFPQTNEVRGWRAKLKKGELSAGKYIRLIRKEIEKAIRWQEEVGLDVLVHGEFERNDMVEYFGEKLKGFAFTKNGWIQSYGSRCVKPPVIYGDISRPDPMSVEWISFAQSLTQKPVKGMLTGPVTMLQWSFVRDDQPHSETCNQIALAIRDEVLDLEKAGIPIIQIDEPALREGLPLKRSGWKSYLEWAVRAFRLTYAGVKEETQVHTHMCYSEFRDIIESIAALDADVITMECSRSQMELLDVFAEFKYPNDIGPGLYDIHSPRIPKEEEIRELIRKAVLVIPEKQIWINPDCGLKTRSWDETRTAIANMVNAAKAIKAEHAVLTE